MPQDGRNLKQWVTGGVINQAPGAGTAPVVPKTEAKAEPKVGQSGVSAAQVEAAVAAAAQAAKLPTAEVIGKQPMTQIFQGMYWCNVCTSGMNCESALDMHLQGKKHKAKLGRVDATLFLPHEPLGPLTKGPGVMKSKKASVNAAAAAAAKVEPTFKCDICEVDFNNEIPYNAHMVGKKHAKKMNAPKINCTNSRFSCALCQFVGNSETHLEAHIKGKSHAKKAGLPAPPPGPAAQPPSAEKKQKPYRFNPYFKSRDRATSSSSDTGGFYQTTRIPQVKTVSAASLTSTEGANPAAYATGIVGNYGFTL